MLVGYNTTFYNSPTLKEAAEIYLHHLPADITVLVSMGNSGCAIASAMLALSDRLLRHVSLRKTEGEKILSHSYWSGGYLCLRQPDTAVAIVDDFISNGGTLNRILNQLKDEVETSRIKCIIVNHVDCETRPWNIPIIEAFDKVTKLVIPDAICEPIELLDLPVLAPPDRKEGKNWLARNVQVKEYSLEDGSTVRDYIYDEVNNGK